MEKLLTIYCLNDYNYCYVYFSFFRHLVNYYKIFGGLLSNMTINRRNVFYSIILLLFLQNTQSVFKQIFRNF